MQISANNARRIILLSMAVLIAPMVVFPGQLGLDLAETSVLTILMELAFYAVAVLLVQRKGGLRQLLMAGGACLIYRLLLGVTFGLLITAIYSIKLGFSVTLGMSSYLPAVLFHIAVSPFILMPVISAFYRSTPGQTRRPVAQTETRTEGALLHDRGERQSTMGTMPKFKRDLPFVKDTTEIQESSYKATSDMNGFERAVKYIGEHSSVRLAAMVDHEGLLLSSFRRNNADPELWAPLSLMLFKNSEELLRRGELNKPEKLDSLLNDQRVCLACYDQFYLIVLAEREADDVLSIRVNQGMEIVKKYINQRFGKQRHPEGEKTYV